MIPEIGAMVGCYIITRLLHLSGQEDVSRTVKIFSGVSILVTILVILDLVMRGTTNMPTK